MNNWIEESARKLREQEEGKGEQERIEYSRYVRRVACAKYFWLLLEEAIEANVAGLNKLLPRSLSITSKLNRLTIRKPNEFSTEIEIQFSDVIPQIELAVRQLTPTVPLSPERQSFTFRLIEDIVHLKSSGGEFGDLSASGAAEFFLNIVMRGRA
jgi:hypothetical protein